MFLSALNKRYQRLGVRSRLVLLFVTIFGTFFSAFSAAVYFYISDIQTREFDAALYNYVIDISHSAAFKPHQALTEVTNTSEMILPFSLGETRLEILSPDGQTYLQSKNQNGTRLPFSAQKLALLRQKPAVYEDIHLPGHFRMVSHLAERPGVGEFIVQAAVPMILLDVQRDALLTFLATVVPLMLLVAALGGLLFSRRALAPVSAIIAKANEIEAKHLSEPLPIPEARDEIHDLAVTLNGLLRRLEKAFRSQEGFIADASHQLRTPLSILNGELELFRKGPRSAEETEAFVVSAAQEIKYLSDMVEDLLILARMDAAGGVLDLKPQRLDERLLEIAARLERSPHSRGVRFSLQLHAAEELEGPFTLQAEPELLRSLVENLLDNAVKYSPVDGTVLVELNDSGNEITLRVQDSGSGIPASALPRVFERFYRSESHSSQAAGSGLGLSIVQRIAHLHGAKVAASNQPGSGAVFEVHFPSTH